MTMKVTIPKMDANMMEATVGEWRVDEGDAIHQDDPLVDLITDKTTYELQAPASGNLLKILAPTNSVLPIGYVIAFIGENGENVPDVDAVNQRLLERFQSEKTARLDDQEAEARPSEPTSKRNPRTRVRATPSAKRLAKENNIDLSDVKAAFDTDVVNEKMVADYLREHVK